MQDLTFGTSKHALTTNLNKVTAVILYNMEGKGYYFEAVLLITEPDAEEICICWEPISSQLLCARYQTRLMNMAIIERYASAYSSDEEIKDQFCNNWQCLMGRVS